MKASLAALEEYRALCRDIDCDFEEQDSYVYSLDRRDKLEREIRALSQIGFPAEYVPEPALPMQTAGAVRFRKQAQFHPLKFLFAIAEGLPIHEHTKVLELKPGGAKTHQGTVRAKHIIIATHFPVLNKHGGYYVKLYQGRSYVLALENAPKLDGMYVDGSGKGLSFRSYGDLLLLGGGGHRTGKKGGGLLTPTTPRCPHLGCALKYNPQEHSWDCPCHGSRFREDGQLIDNPSTDDLRQSPHLS